MRPQAAAVSCTFIALFATLATPVVAAPRPFTATETTRWQLGPSFDSASVKIAGDWIAVFATNREAQTKSLYVYRRASATSWINEGKLTEGYASTDCCGPYPAMDMQNSTIAITWGGSPDLVVFKRSGTTWVQQAVASATHNLDGAIKIDGARILVGAGNCGDGDIFEPDAAGTWRITAHLNEGRGGGCGEDPSTHSLALSGDVALLYGENWSDATTPSWIGSWQRSGSGWQRLGQLPKTATPGFVPSISLRGSLAVTNGLFPAGANHVYLRSGTTWTTLPSFRPLDAYRLTRYDGAFAQRRGWLAQRRPDADAGGSIIDVWRQGSDNRFRQVAQLQTHDRAGLEFDIYDNRVVAASSARDSGGPTVYVFELPADLSTPAPVRDDFQGGGNAAWHSVAGPSPRVSSGRFVQTSTAAKTMALAGNTGWTNQAIEADFSTNSSASTQSYAGLVARAGSGSYYYAVQRKDGQVELGRVMGSSRRVLASAPNPEPRTFNRLRLEARGSLLDVHVNGRRLLSASDSLIRSGESGFITSYTALVLDNFTSTPHSQKIYESDFANEPVNDDSLFGSPWTVRGGDWQMAEESGSTIKQQRTASGGARLITGVANDEQTVETLVRIDGTFATDSNWVGVIARYKDDGNLYYLSLRGSHQLTMRKVVGSVATELAGQTFNAVAGQYYYLRLEVAGAKLRGYVNGELRLEVEDDSLASGRSGIATNNTRASFARFLAYQP